MQDWVVRDGDRVVPFCSTCGCRLRQMPNCKHYKHYYDTFTGVDMRGHKCPDVFYGGSIFQNQVFFTNAGYNCH